MKEKHPIIGEVRGKGLWLTAEFIKDPKTREKNFEAAAIVNERCLSWFVRASSRRLPSSAPSSSRGWTYPKTRSPR